MRFDHLPAGEEDDEDFDEENRVPNPGNMSKNAILVVMMMRGLTTAGEAKLH
jgi:hypothetical protein